MLVVLNGAASINGYLFARNIVQTLNRLDKYQMDTYTIDYVSVPIVARNAAGEVVFKEGCPEVEGVTTLRPENDEEAAVKARIEGFNNAIQWTIRFGGVSNLYSDFQRDYGLDDSPNYEQDYSQLIDGYNTRTLAHMVLYGQFSKTFVEQLRQDLGEKEVLVLNITRNPSAQYQLYGFMRDDTVQIPDIPNTTDLIISSVVSGYTLKSLPYVTTVKYEDVLAHGFFKFGGFTVPTPKELVRYNQFITLDDKDLLADENADLAVFNVKIDDLATTLGRPSLPKNIFQALGYTPLTYSQTISPP